MRFSREGKAETLAREGMRIWQCGLLRPSPPAAHRKRRVGQGKAWKAYPAVLARTPLAALGSDLKA